MLLYGNVSDGLFPAYDPVQEAIDAYVYGGISIEALEWQLERALRPRKPEKTDWMED